jgi:hypothetical protein
MCTGTWRPRSAMWVAVVAVNLRLCTDSRRKAVRIAPVTAVESVRPPIAMLPRLTARAARVPTPFPMPLWRAEQGASV